MTTSRTPPDPRLVERLLNTDTASLSDANKGLRVLPAEIRPLVTGRRMVGRAVTAKAGDDLMAVIGALEAGSAGDVLVVSAGEAGLAMAGELFCTEAQRRGMTGVVIDGLCRDTALLVRLGLPVYARGATPKAAPAKAVPEVNVRVVIGGITVRPGDLVVGDDDGVLVGSPAEFAAAIEGAEAIQVREKALRVAIENGQSLFESLNFTEHAANVRAAIDSKLTFS